MLIKSQKRAATFLAALLLCPSFSDLSVFAGPFDVKVPDTRVPNISTDTLTPVTPELPRLGPSAITPEQEQPIIGSDPGGGRGGGGDPPPTSSGRAIAVTVCI